MKKPKFQKPKYYPNDPVGLVCPYCKRAGFPCTFVNSMSRAYARAACKKRHPNHEMDS